MEQVVAEVHYMAQIADIVETSGGDGNLTVFGHEMTLRLAEKLVQKYDELYRSAGGRTD
jgi:hypothetical protein